MIFLYYWDSSGNHTLPLPVIRDTRDSIRGIKGKLKVVLSHLEFYLIHAARQIRKNSLRVDPTGKLIKIAWISGFLLQTGRLLLAVNNDRVNEKVFYYELPLCIDKATGWRIVSCNEKNHRPYNKPLLILAFLFYNSIS